MKGFCYRPPADDGLMPPSVRGYGVRAHGLQIRLHGWGVGFTCSPGPDLLLTLGLQQTHYLSCPSTLTLVHVFLPGFLKNSGIYRNKAEARAGILGTESVSHHGDMRVEVVFHFRHKAPAPGDMTGLCRGRDSLLTQPP